MTLEGAKDSLKSHRYNELFISERYLSNNTNNNMTIQGTKKRSENLTP